jgi:ferritin-like metal-binding protein YciE
MAMIPRARGRTALLTCRNIYLCAKMMPRRRAGGGHRRPLGMALAKWTFTSLFRATNHPVTAEPPIKMQSLEDPFMNELRDLYHMEHQVLKALPKMIRKAASPELESMLEEHQDQTEHQAERLETIVEQLGLKAKGKKCAGMEGIIGEGKELLGADAEPPVLDAGIIAAAQKVEHYEIAGYGCARTWAHLLGHEDAANLLEQSLREEEAMDQRLTDLADHIINAEAATAGD